MKVYRPADAVIFLEQARDFLLEREAENNLLLGIAGILVANPRPSDEKRLYWTVVEEGRVVGAALWTPPFKPVVSHMEDRALGELLVDMSAFGMALNGVSGPEDLALRFASAWEKKTGLKARRVMRMLIQVLERVRESPSVDGAFRMAMSADIPWLIEWATRFHEQIGLGEPVDNRRIVTDYVNDKRLFFWQDGGRPVSIAGYVGPTPHGVRVNLVFTPPEFRDRGYARACVSALSRYLLNKGFAACFLFSDRDYPISNRVYERVGYRPVADWALYDFGSPTS